MKKEIVSGKYLICIVGIMLLCFTSRFPGSDVDLHEMTLMAFVTYGKSQLLQMGEMASSYSVAVSFRDMEWFIVLLPVMSVLPFVNLLKNGSADITICQFPERQESNIQ